MPTVSSDMLLHINYESEKYINPLRISKQPLLQQGQKLLNLPVKSARVLSQSDLDNKVIEVTFDNSESLLDFHPGDIIGILPENNADEVDRLLERLNLQDQRDLKYDLHSGSDFKIPPHIPTIGSLKCTFRHFIDIRRLLSKSLIKTMCLHTRDKSELCQMERIYKDRDSYNEQILKKNLSICRFLDLFPSCLPPIAMLLQHLPRLMPRPYTICSSPIVNRDEIKICFSLVEFADCSKGVTTGWLDDVLFTKNILIDLPVYFKTSTFKMPEDQAVPIAMICNGTGIAPFIGFLEERQALRKKMPNLEYGPMYLYFGCRYSFYIYKNRIDEYVDDCTLSKLKVAYSRCEGSDYKYVQDSLDDDELNQMFEKSAVFYLCGSNKMIKEIESLCLAYFKKNKKMSEVSAKNHLKDLKNSKKFILDVWL